jgi:hypothetical protein
MPVVRRRSRRLTAGAALLLGLIIAGLASGGTANAAQSPDIVEQHWEISAETVANVALAKSLVIPRGDLPYNTSMFDPAPTLSFEVVGRVANGSGSGSWRVDLKNPYGSTIASVSFPRTDTGFTIRKASFTATFLSQVQSIDLSPVQPTGSLAGTFDMQKAYVKIHQEGIITKTVGRVPMGTKQLSITSPSYVSLSDPSLYKFKTSDFDPAPTVKLRASGAGTPCDFDVSLYDDTAATQVTGSELEFTTNAASAESGALTLFDDHVYRVKVKLDTTCIAGGSASSQSADPQPQNSGDPGVPNGDFLGADLVFEQSTTDTRGITRTVGFYPGVTAAVDATSNIQTLNFPFRIPAAKVPNAITAEWTYVAKRTTGTGNVRASLYGAGTQPLDAVPANQTNTGSDFMLANPHSVASLSGGTDLSNPDLPYNSKASIDATGTTGRISATLLRLVLNLRDVAAPVISAPSISWTNTAFSPVLAASNPKSKTTLSFTVSDFSSVTYSLSLSGPTPMTVNNLTTTGTGSTKSASWTWDGRKDGVIVNDGTYTATITPTDGAGNAAAALAVSQTVKVDTVAPTITSFGASTSPATSPVRFSPGNGDGYLDTVTFSGAFSEPATCSLFISSGPTYPCGSGSSFSIVWNGVGVYSDGTLSVYVIAYDSAGNQVTSSTTNVIRDTAGPVISDFLVKAKTCSTCQLMWTTAFSPGTDESKDYVDISATLTDAWTPFDWTLEIKDGAGNPVRTFYEPGTFSKTWDGTNASGVPQSNGTYTIVLTVRDGGRNVTTSQTSVILDTLAPTIGEPVPGDKANTVFRNQPLYAPVADSLSGIELGGGGFSVWDQTTSNSVSPGTQTITNTLVRTSGAATIVGHNYSIYLQVSDKAGNTRTLSWQITGVSLDVPSSTAIIPDIASTSTTSPSLGNRTFTFTDVPLKVRGYRVTLHGAPLHAGMGSLGQRVDLSSATVRLYSIVAGNEVFLNEVPAGYQTIRPVYQQIASVRPSVSEQSIAIRPVELYASSMSLTFATVADKAVLHLNAPTTGFISACADPSGGCAPDVTASPDPMPFFFRPEDASRIGARLAEGRTVINDWASQNGEGVTLGEIYDGSYFQLVRTTPSSNWQSFSIVGGPLTFPGVNFAYPQGTPIVTPDSFAAACGGLYCSSSAAAAGNGPSDCFSVPDDPCTQILHIQGSENLIAKQEQREGHWYDYHGISSQMTMSFGVWEWDYDELGFGLSVVASFGERARFSSRGYQWSKPPAGQGYPYSCTTIVEDGIMGDQQAGVTLDNNYAAHYTDETLMEKGSAVTPNYCNPVGTKPDLSHKRLDYAVVHVGRLTQNDGNEGALGTLYTNYGHNYSTWSFDWSCTGGAGLSGLSAGCSFTPKETTSAWKVQDQMDYMY